MALLGLCALSGLERRIHPGKQRRDVCATRRSRSSSVAAQRRGSRSLASSAVLLYSCARISRQQDAVHFICERPPPRQEIKNQRSDTTKHRRRDLARTDPEKKKAAEEGKLRPPLRYLATRSTLCRAMFTIVSCGPPDPMASAPPTLVRVRLAVPTSILSRARTKRVRQAVPLQPGSAPWPLSKTGCCS